MKRDASVPSWQAYERAVAQFLHALEPGASVAHNIKLADVDTGRSRQRDVWVEALVAGIFRVKILISCKKLRRRVNEQDLDALVGEIRSSGAHMGAMFADSGFTKPALAKAKRLGIACCRIYEFEPPHFPHVLPLHVYACVARLVLDWDVPAPEWSLKTFQDLLAVNDQRESGDVPLATLLVQVFEELHVYCLKQLQIRRALVGEYVREIIITDDDKRYAPFHVWAGIRWRTFKALPQASLLNGTYSFNDKTFVGSVVLPAPSLEDVHPGPGWEELPSNSAEEFLEGLFIVSDLGELESALQSAVIDLDSPRISPKSAGA